jgi:hypothetical protein
MAIPVQSIRNCAEWRSRHADLAALQQHVGAEQQVALSGVRVVETLPIRRHAQGAKLARSAQANLSSG